MSFEQKLFALSLFDGSAFSTIIPARLSVVRAYNSLASPVDFFLILTKFYTCIFFFFFFFLILARSNFDHYARECNFGILKKKQKQNKGVV